MEQQTSFTRHIAQKITIATITGGTYIKEDDDTPNFLLTQNNEKIYRVNVMGIVINKETIGSITSLLLDDSTDTLTLRSFEPNEKLDSIEVGTPVLVIGKVRMYNGSLYLTSEIITKIDPAWLKVRSCELTKSTLNIDTLNENSIQQNTKEKILNQNNSNNEISPELTGENEDIKDTKTNTISTRSNVTPNVEDFSIKEETHLGEDDLLPTEKIMALISELDTGDGVAIDEIIEKSTIVDVENIIERLIKNGEVFNNLPGKVKVL